MERRRELRITTNQNVAVTVLGQCREQIQGRAVELSGRGIRIFVPKHVSPGDPVKIGLEETLLLGEICYCHPYESGFMIGVELDQALNGLPGLARLNRALLGGGDAERPTRVILPVSEQA